MRASNTLLIVGVHGVVTNIHLVILEVLILGSVLRISTSKEVLDDQDAMLKV